MVPGSTFGKEKSGPTLLTGPGGHFFLGVQILLDSTTILSTLIPYTCRCYGPWGLFFLITTAVILTLAAIISISFGVPHDNSSSNEFAPNETRTFSYSNAFCESMTAHVDVTSGDDDGTGTGYILSQAPALGDYDSFTFSEQPCIFQVICELPQLELLPLSWIHPQCVGL